MTPVGRFTFMPFMCTWLKLTIMKLASRKNMMSINGMISIRAFLCGMGEANLIEDLQIDDRVRVGRCRRISASAFALAFGFQHHFQVRRCGLQFEL